MSNITKIKISGTSYNIKDENASNVVELTQAEYDALPATAKTSNSLFVITDAEAGDLTNYYTKSQTNTLLGGKQDTLVSGTNIKTINNTSILGSGNIVIQGGSDINVVQTTGTSTTDVMSQDAVTTQLNGYVTTSTDQNVSGIKTFVGEKRIKFKQQLNSNKLGFTMQNTALSNNELATFELRPKTFTIDGVQHPLLYLGHYRNTSVADAGVPQTVIGFRQYDETNAAAYHYLMPLPDKAKTPFSLTKSFKDYYAPMGFKNGSTMVTADETGVVDLSSVLGGLKLVKLTQAEYDALTTKDDNTVYFIGDTTNGYTMKIGSANVN